MIKSLSLELQFHLWKQKVTGNNVWRVTGWWGITAILFLAISQGDYCHDKPTCSWRLISLYLTAAEFSIVKIAVLCLDCVLNPGSITSNDLWQEIWVTLNLKITTCIQLIFLSFIFEKILQTSFTHSDHLIKCVDCFCKKVPTPQIMNSKVPVLKN